MGPTTTTQKRPLRGVKATSRATAPCLGAHVNGGLKGSVARAVEIGAQCIQIFIGSPQTWRPPSPPTAEIQSFCAGVKQAGLGPVFVHGNYLVNLASADEGNLSKSIENLKTALYVSDAIGAEGLIFHPGSAGSATYDEAINRVVRALSIVLDGYEGHCRLLLEVCAGQGQTIGDRFSEFGHILKAMNKDERLGVCWDTCHLFNAGYDVASASGLRRTMEEFESEVGFEWLYALHANDSKTPLGARRDRHENIGMGCIGESGFALMMQQTELRSVPWILEVPGAERKGPDRANLEVLRQLAAAAAAGYNYLD